MITTPTQRLLLSGNEAVALSARGLGVSLGTGYPGTPSTEILEAFSGYGGQAQWAPNEKVAFEVALGVAFAGARALCTMKHVGLNVAADVLFTAAYTGVTGALIVVVCDDPGMASSQNEQDSRRYALAAGVPMFEPADSQEAYDLFARAVAVSEQFHTPVLFRMTTRICHTKALVCPAPLAASSRPPAFTKNIHELVMVPSNARPAHRRLRARLDALAAYAATGPHRLWPGERTLGIITSGVATMHAREADPAATILQLGMTYPLPLEAIRDFAAGVDRCVVVEEGDPYLVEACRTAGIAVEGKAEAYRFGELTVDRVRRLLAGAADREPAGPRGKGPELCQGCPHRGVFQTLADLDCIVPGDIGCHSLGALPPFTAMDTLVCMGSGIGVGLGMRHILPEAQARRVVSVIGDSTFIHSGITALVEMVYNPPPTGHVVVILDNNTTAMTGLQEHPGTGCRLDAAPTHKLSLEDLARAIGVPHVSVIDPGKDLPGLAAQVQRHLAAGDLAVVIARRPCILALKKHHALQQEKEAPQ